MRKKEEKSIAYSIAGSILCSINYFLQKAGIGKTTVYIDEHTEELCTQARVYIQLNNCGSADLQLKHRGRDI